MSPWSRWHSIATAILLALAVFVQFTVVLQTRPGQTVRGDATKYVFYAYNLKYRHVFSREQSFGREVSVQPMPDKLTLPGYPAFLSLFLDGIPDTAFLLRGTVAQAALGVIAVLLTFAIALRLLPVAWAMGAGILTAITPHLSVVNTHLMTEPLFTPLMLAATLAALFAARRDARLVWFVLTGVLLGCASLVRPQLQLVPLLLATAAIGSRQLRSRLPGILLACACFLAVMGPWWWRNAHIERPQGEPDLLAASIYHGSFPGFMYGEDPRTLGYAYRFDPEQRVASTSVRAAVDHVGHQFSNAPWQTLRWYLIGKPRYFLSWGFIEGASDVLIYRVNWSPWNEKPFFLLMRQTARTLHWPLMLLGLLVAVVAVRRPALLVDERATSAVVLLSGLFLYLMVLHAIGAPYPRYNVPFRPLVFVLALVGVHRIWLAVRTWRDRPEIATEARAEGISS